MIVRSRSHIAHAHNLMRFLIRSLYNKRIRNEVLLIGALLLILLVHVSAQFGVDDTWFIIAGALFGVAPVFWNALKALRAHEWASMDMLASLALLFSLVEQAWSSAVFIALMLAAARLLETLTEARMERSIRSLMKLKPLTAKVEREGKLLTISTNEVVVGDIVIVDAGERLAVDGVVESGEAAVDESSLTGESLPVDKEAGSIVSSSTLITSGSLRIKTTRVGKDTTLERIITLVESSQEEKPEIESLGEKFGKFYLIFIFVGAALLLLITHNVTLVLAVVLVVCADDVVIAIPLVHLRAIGTAAKRGIIIKGGRHLEALGKVKTIVFDKTGTLTEGKPHVTGTVTADGVPTETLISLAAACAGRSTHPLSRALVAHAKEKGVAACEVESAVVVGGKGIRATQGGTPLIMGNRKFIEESGYTLSEVLGTQADAHAATGKSISFIGRDGVVMGFCALGDTVKSDARKVIEELRTVGIERVIMLSGDNERAAGALAEEIGIDTWYANLLPEDKVAKIKEFSMHGMVAMVGDGVNDAAALSLAHVGIAMGGLGSDGAIESANIVLMHDNLGAIPQTIRLAHSVRRISIQDFGIWGISNGIGLILVFSGIIGPAGAAAYNFISDFFPLLNSVRARFPR